jgi:superfamily I DNA/RNA helicase
MPCRPAGRHGMSPMITLPDGFDGRTAAHCQPFGAGHARVSAVAGSGKTTTMVARIGHLLQRGTPAEQILVS